MFDNLLNFLNGHKTYILAGITIVGVWIAYATGAPDPACVPSVADACMAAVTLQAAIISTMGALGFITVRHAVATEATKTVAVVKGIAPSTAAKAMEKKTP